MSERLEEFNNLALRRLLECEDIDQLVEEIRKKILEKFPNEKLDIEPDRVKAVLKWSMSRITKLDDLLSPSLSFIWVRPKTIDIDEKIRQHFKKFTDELRVESDNFDDKEELNRLFKAFCNGNNVKFQIFMKSLRSVLSGLKEGPSVAEMMSILGKDTTIRRLEESLGK